MSDAIFQLLKNRAVIAVSGEDRFSFLQGLITNDVNSISHSGLLYALMLTPQGKFLYDFFLISDGDRILLDHESIFTQEILKKLTMYKLRSDVKFIDVTDEYNIVFLSKHLDYNNILKDRRHEKLCYRGYIKKIDFSFFVESYGLIEATGRYEQIIYENTIPEPHKDMIRDKSFPIEYAMDEFHAISFTKGCYLGQENISRTKYRGTVRKKLMKFVCDQEITGVDIGEEISFGDIKVGVYCSSWGKLGKALMRIEDIAKCGSHDLKLSRYNIQIV